MKVRFVAERGMRGEDNIEVVLNGIINLPKHLVITAQDFSTAIGTGKVFIDSDVLKVEADLREQEFHLYPTIGFESIVEDEINGCILIRELDLQTISLQPLPNTDPGIKTIKEQLQDGTAQVLE